MADYLDRVRRDKRVDSVVDMRATNAGIIVHLRPSYAGPGRESTVVAETTAALRVRMRQVKPALREPVVHRD